MKKRLDEIMVERGLASTVMQARALIMAGQVSAAGARLEKPGQSIDTNSEIHLKDQPRYASRAGNKLESVAQPLSLDFMGRVILDVGSSTGGFTDFMLQHGAAKVYCVDVGTGQLAYKLRQDPRVVVMEQTDIRSASLPQAADMAVIDVSFISLTSILQQVVSLVTPGGLIVAMAKPQFEASRELADKYRGVIPEGPERNEVLEDLRRWLKDYVEIVGECDSAVTGAEGNHERFFVLKSEV